MRAEDTLQFMMDFYHNIYPNRKSCLNQLFCVIGNGYKWVDGELVDDSEFLSRWELKSPIIHAKPSDLNTLLEDIRIRVSGKDESEWYPLSKEYSYLYNYPEDIKPDWLELINETKQLLITDGIILEENNNDSGTV